MKKDEFDFLGWMVIILFLVAVLALTYWLAGGYIDCMFSEEPTICASLKGVNGG